MEILKFRTPLAVSASEVWALMSSWDAMRLFQTKLRRITGLPKGGILSGQTFKLKVRSYYLFITNMEYEVLSISEVNKRISIQIRLLKNRTVTSSSRIISVGPNQSLIEDHIEISANDPKEAAILADSYRRDLPKTYRRIEKSLTQDKMISI